MKIKRNNKFKKSKQSFIYVLLALFSFIQIHWIFIASSAGAALAAAMFGDKAYWINIEQQADSLIEQNNAKKAVELIENKLTEYEKQRQENTNLSSYTQVAVVNSLYFELAKSKEAIGAPVADVTKAYEKAVFSKAGGQSFVWLFKHLDSTGYAEIVKGYVKNISSDNYKYLCSDLTSQFVATGNWSAFKAFLDTFFAETTDQVRYAKIFEISMSENDTWLKEYKDYCKANPSLAEYIFEKDYSSAKDCIDAGNYKKAIEFYENILKSCNQEKTKSKLKLEICQASFNAGEYNNAITMADTIISEYKAKYRLLAKEAILIKGQAYLQTGELDKAINEFTTLIVEYPEAKQTPEANFFIGYIYMLQNNFDKSKEILSMVIKDFPRSGYATKANLCLTRIETMSK